MRKNSKAIFTATICTLFIVTLIGNYNQNSQAQFTYPVPREESFAQGWGSFSIFDSFNPFIPNGVQWGGGWVQCCVDYLWFQDVYTNETLYRLITGWEYSNDYTEFTLNVRRNVRWSDGVAFTAHDIEFSINYGMNNSVGQYAGFGDFLDWIEVPDDYTVVLHLKVSSPRLHHSFYGKASSIVPEHIWKDKDVLTYKNNPPIGTGPYLLYKVLPEAGMFIWVRDENWWGKDALGLFPGPKYQIFESSGGLETSIPALARGDQDYGPSLRGPQIRDTVASETTEYAVINNIEFGSFGFVMNCDPSKYPLNLPEFRRAISYCINKEKMATLYPSADHGVTTNFIFPRVATLEWCFDQDLADKYGTYYDPDKAVEILNALNFIDRNGDGIRETPEGKKLTFEILDFGGDYSHNCGIDVMCIDLADELTKIGIEATVRVAPDNWWELISLGNFDISGIDVWLVTPVDDILTVFEYLSSKYYAPIGQEIPYVDPLLNPSRYHNATLDAIVEQLEAITPAAPEADALYHDALEIVMRDLPYIPVLLPYSFWTVSTKYWAGYPETCTISAPHHTMIEISFHLRSTQAPTTISYITAYITQSVAAFTGVDGISYGPYEEGDAAVLPKGDADRLIAAGQASLVPTQLSSIATAISELTTRVSGLETDLADASSDLAALSASVNSMTMALYASLAVNIIVVIVVIIILVRKKS